MYLSRLILNPRSKQVRRDFSNVHDMHRTILSAFPDVETHGSARQVHGVLFRHEPAGRAGLEIVLVQSRSKPVWNALNTGYFAHTTGEPLNPSMKEVGPIFDSLSLGMTLGFRLRANSTRKIMTKSGPDGERRNGRRVELRGEDQLFAWLVRKGEMHGFRLPRLDGTDGQSSVRIRYEPKLKGTQRTREESARTITVTTALFEGVLQITDLERFKSALESGIGPGKAYGCGLLSIRPAQQRV